jgi:hypothetical protein
MFDLRDQTTIDLGLDPPLLTRDAELLAPCLEGARMLCSILRPGEKIKRFTRAQW